MAHSRLSIWSFLANNPELTNFVEKKRQRGFSKIFSGCMKIFLKPTAGACSLGQKQAFYKVFLPNSNYMGCGVSSTMVENTPPPLPEK